MSNISSNKVAPKAIISERQKKIRNFSIVAHIDHGKTTFADRVIQLCGAMTDREMTDQVLDSMDLEKERGITIKAHSVSLEFKAYDGEVYLLNFIDTPGHVDFSYEVSRSLYACEGALLIVDASQGVEAQSVANCYKAVDQGLEVLPVLNKIDLPQADPDRVLKEIEDIIGIDTSHSVSISAKEGKNIELALNQLVKLIPHPFGDESASLQALIIDSWFDSYLGIVVLVRIKSGKVSLNDRIHIKSVEQNYKIEKLGIFNPKRIEKKELLTGEVGYLIAGIKNIHGAPVGDTITHEKTKDTPAMPGFQKTKPMVYAGLFPTSTDDFENFREALDKLSLNDASLNYEPETSDALGHGFRCGFLGLLHMDITQERLEREYNLGIITTAPTVVYEILMKKGEIIHISNPSDLPDSSKIDEIREPIAEVSILSPNQYIGKVIELCISRRGIQKSLLYLANQVSIVFYIPMSEVVLDFFDRLKSISRGYASCDFSFKEYVVADLVKLDVLINGSKVDSLSLIVHRDLSRSQGIALVDKMKAIIPRQMFDVAIQAAIGGNIIARQNVKALRKNVLAKCYGGDVSRKRKLLEKQKEGKKRMKRVGSVDIPQEAFLSVLNIDKS